jgi:hypothetical protein
MAWYNAPGNSTLVALLIHLSYPRLAIMSTVDSTAEPLLRAARLAPLIVFLWALIAARYTVELSVMPSPGKKCTPDGAFIAA